MGITCVYVSNAGDGDISIFRLDAGGELQPLGRAAAGQNVMPLAVSPDKRHLHAAIRSQPNRVVTYRIDSTTGALALAGTAPLPDSMAYLSTDRRGRLLFAASYGGDILSVTRIGADGLPQDSVSQLVSTQRHPHSILTHPGNRFVYACILGVDQVLQFALDEAQGRLLPVEEGFVRAPSGSGPRHLAFAPNGELLYVVGELSGTVTSYRIGPTGALSLVWEVNGLAPSSTLAPGVARGPGVVLDATPRIWASDIHVRPDGRSVYFAERTSSSISVLSADPGGKLSYAGNCPVENQPRGFAIDPAGRFMVVSGEKSAHLGVYAIDSDTGALDPLGKYASGKSANWVAIVGLP